jgi:hypothetical protein
MALSRRGFLYSASAAGLAYAALASFTGSARAFSANSGLKLLPDPDGLLDLPQGFSYTLVSRAGETMSDGFVRPGRFDGMACFPVSGDPTKCILTRNHENWPDSFDQGPFGPDNALLDKLPADKLYDRRADGSPYFGGVTILVYDLKNRRLDRDFLALIGTAGNCAGGPTPWGSWLTCEETTVGPAQGAQKEHGFVFEVPASSQGLVDPLPLKAMGRFVHEAAAVDPSTDIVYLTEDNPEGLFYRFLPKRRKNLAAGGRLQALTIRGWKSADTRNWPRDWGSTGAGGVKVGQTFEVDWIDLEDVEAPAADLAVRGHAAGAARFCRGEGMAFGMRVRADSASAYFNCTQGGAMRSGQVWRYRPSPREGRRGEAREPGVLELIYESPGADLLDLCDNLAVSPRGDLVLCEDGLGDQFLRFLTPDGRMVDVARNADPMKSEFCGACFSPDGRALFVNVQEPGYTFAVEGPWEKVHA